MKIICPKIFAAMIGKSILEKDCRMTLLFLKCAYKFKIRKLSISTVDDPDILKVHKDFPFIPNKSVFTTNQTYKQWPAIWSVCVLFKTELAKLHPDFFITSGAGNNMQHQYPHYVYELSDEGEFTLIPGIYTLNIEKQCYDFLKKDADLKSPAWC